MLLLAGGGLLLLPGDGSGQESGKRRPSAVADADGAGGGATPAPTAEPEAMPTQGVYIPPRPIRAEATMRRAAPSPKPTRARSQPRPPTAPPAMRCPEGWERVPPLREWCRKNGLKAD